jgi:hypothetical protein
MMITGLQLGRLLSILPELVKNWQLATAIAYATGNRYLDVWFQPEISYFKCHTFTAFFERSRFGNAQQKKDALQRTSIKL